MGVGLQIAVAEEGGPVRIAVVIEGSPAERAGIRAGDRLLAINGVPVDPSDKM